MQDGCQACHPCCLFVYIITRYYGCFNCDTLYYSLYLVIYTKSKLVARLVVTFDGFSYSPTVQRRKLFCSLECNYSSYSLAVISSKRGCNMVTSMSLCKIISITYNHAAQTTFSFVIVSENGSGQVNSMD